MQKTRTLSGVLGTSSISISDCSFFPVLNGVLFLPLAIVLYAELTCSWHKGLSSTAASLVC